MTMLAGTLLANPTLGSVLFLNVVAAYGLVMYVVASLCLPAHRRAQGGTQEYP
jgi:phage shock protein PspC (stress-responsive transcriptional regulator)